jgi:hypothetical protein
MTYQAKPDAHWCMYIKRNLVKPKVYVYKKESGLNLAWEFSVKMKPKVYVYKKESSLNLAWEFSGEMKPKVYVYKNLAWEFSGEMKPKEYVSRLKTLMLSLN